MAVGRRLSNALDGAHFVDDVIILANFWKSLSFMPVLYKWNAITCIQD